MPAFFFPFGLFTQARYIHLCDQRRTADDVTSGDRQSLEIFGARPMSCGERGVAFRVVA